MRPKAEALGYLICGLVGVYRLIEESGSLRANTHVSDDEAIANMGHPDCAGTGEERESARARSRSIRCAQDDN